MDAITFTDLVMLARTVGPINIATVVTHPLTKDGEITEIGVHRLADGFTWGTRIRPNRRGLTSWEREQGVTMEELAEAPTIEEALTHLHEVAPLDNTIIATFLAKPQFVPIMNQAMRQTLNIDSYITSEQCIDLLYLAQRVIPYGGITDYAIPSLQEYFNLTHLDTMSPSGMVETFAHLLAHLLEEATRMTVPPATVQDLVDMTTRPIKPLRKEREALKWLRTARKELTSPDLSDGRKRAVIQAYSDVYYSCYRATPDLRSLNHANTY